MRNVSAKDVEKITTYILRSVTSFLYENRAVYEKMLRDTVQSGRVTDDSMAYDM